MTDLEVVRVFMDGVINNITPLLFKVMFYNIYRCSHSILQRDLYLIKINGSS